MKPKFTEEFEHLMASWLRRVSELHQYGLDLTDLGPEALESGEMSRMVELVNRIDSVTDALIATSDAYSQKLNELAGVSPYDAAPGPYDEVESDRHPQLDFSLPSLVKKGTLLN